MMIASPWDVFSKLEEIPSFACEINDCTNRIGIETRRNLQVDGKRMGNSFAIYLFKVNARMSKKTEEKQIKMYLFALMIFQ